MGDFIEGWGQHAKERTAHYFKAGRPGPGSPVKDPVIYVSICLSSMLTVPPGEVRLSRCGACVKKIKTEGVPEQLSLPIPRTPTVLDMRIGAKIDGFVGGLFGRDYPSGLATIEAIGTDWIVVRTEHGDSWAADSYPDFPELLVPAIVLERMKIK